MGGRLLALSEAKLYVAGVDDGTSTEATPMLLLVEGNNVYSLNARQVHPTKTWLTKAVLEKLGEK